MKSFRISNQSFTEMNGKGYNFTSWEDHPEHVIIFKAKFLKIEWCARGGENQ